MPCVSNGMRNPEKHSAICIISFFWFHVCFDVAMLCWWPWSWELIFHDLCTHFPGRLLLHWEVSLRICANPKNGRTFVKFVGKNPWKLKVLYDVSPTKPARIHLPGKWQNGHQQSFNLQGISWWLGKNASCIGRMEVIFVLHSKYPSQKELYIYLMLFEKRVRILIDFDVKKRRYQSQTISRTCWKTVESTGTYSSFQIVKIIHFLKGGSTLMALFTFNFPRGPEGESIPPFSAHPNFWCFLFPLLRWRASPIRPHAPNPSWMPRTPIVGPIRRWGRIYDGKNTSWVQIFSRWLFALLWRDVKVYHWKIKISL